MKKFIKVIFQLVTVTILCLELWKFFGISHIIYVYLIYFGIIGLSLLIELLDDYKKLDFLDKLNKTKSNEYSSIILYSAYWLAIIILFVLNR
jgi:hypothetical protein